MEPKRTYIYAGNAGRDAVLDGLKRVKPHVVIGLSIDGDGRGVIAEVKEMAQWFVESFDSFESHPDFIEIMRKTGEKIEEYKALGSDVFVNVCSCLPEVSAALYVATMFHSCRPVSASADLPPLRILKLSETAIHILKALQEDFSGEARLVELSKRVSLQTTSGKGSSSEASKKAKIDYYVNSHLKSHKLVNTTQSGRHLVISLTDAGRAVARATGDYLKLMEKEGKGEEKQEEELRQIAVTK